MKPCAFIQKSVFKNQAFCGNLGFIQQGTDNAIGVHQHAYLTVNSIGRARATVIVLYNRRSAIGNATNRLPTITYLLGPIGENELIRFGAI